MTKEKTNVEALFHAIETEDKEAALDIAAVIAEEFFDNQRRIAAALEKIAEHLAPIEEVDPNQTELDLQVKPRHL